MKITIASDHGGVNIKYQVIGYLREKRYEVLDLSPNIDPLDDFPLYAEDLAKRVSSEECDMGVLVCTTGGGMCAVANKFPKIIAVACDSKEDAEQARKHLDANVLVLGEKKLSRILDTYPNAIRDILDTFFMTEADNEEKYRRRREQIRKIEDDLYRTDLTK